MADEELKHIRWQKIVMDQLGYALNFILSMTIAAIGYWFILLTQDGFKPEYSAKCLMILSLLALSISAISGLFCVVNRLWDFQGTARRARNHPGAPEQDELRSLGQGTWVLFYVHLTAFALGVAALAITLLLTYGWKLV